MIDVVEKHKIPDWWGDEDIMDHVEKHDATDWLEDQGGWMVPARGSAGLKGQFRLSYPCSSMR